VLDNLLCCVDCEEEWIVPKAGTSKHGSLSRQEAEQFGV
jgi:hypothetical protein